MGHGARKDWATDTAGHTEAVEVVLRAMKVSRTLSREQCDSTDAPKGPLWLGRERYGEQKNSSGINWVL